MLRLTWTAHDIVLMLIALFVGITGLLFLQTDYMVLKTWLWVSLIAGTCGVCAVTYDLLHHR